MTIGNEFNTAGAAAAPGWVMPEHLQHLAMADPAVVDDLIETFVTDTAERLRWLRIAFQDGDLAGVSREAHSIIGSSSLMGASNLPELCRKTELAASRKTFENLEQCIEAVESCFANAARGMQLY